VSEEARDGETSRAEPAPATDASPNLLDVPEEPRPKAFKMERKREKRKLVLFKRFRGRWPTAMRIDALSLLSAILGFMSLGMPWIHEVSSYDSEYYSLWHYLIYGQDADLFVFGLVSAGILLGSMLSLFCRVGGVVQLAGLISFATISLSSESGYAFGFYFGVAACASGIASMVLRRPFPFPERLRSIVRSHPDGTVGINVLSIVGGSLGIISLFLVWFYVDYPAYHGTQIYTLLQLASPYYSSTWTTAASIIFITGSILSILTPLGFVGQLVGFSAFVYAMRDNAAYWELFRSSGRYGYGPNAESSYALGFYLGLAALLLVLVSLIIRWRLKLAGDKAAFLISWPMRPLASVVAIGPSEKGTKPWRGLTAVLIQSIKMMFVAVVVLVLAVAAAGLSYAMPWSDIQITISNSDADSRVHFSVYVDGEAKDVDFITPTTYYVKSFDVKAGTVKVGLDYGFPDDSHGTDIDGVVDWTTYVKVKPLRMSVLAVDLESDYLSAPVVTLDVSDYGNGWKLSETSVNDNISYFRQMSWSDIRMVLYDGINHVEWETQTTDLDNGSLSEHAFTQRLFGDITVTCSVVDLLGNGYLDVGDFVLITSGTNYTFSSSATCSFYLLYEPSASLASEVELQGRY
jgi:hypothetical protein